ncbi:flavoprotein [Bacillus infantis]|uniref:NAD(P)-binding domain-containing protein n=1 Tax=Bacillus infantis TaxID=324767 RepID=UPI00101C92BE|nr:NAD(P)-binding domain-containing protein [Bacillus infantis]RYI27215.1 flavoprotein [Bacillus infantis]
MMKRVNEGQLPVAIIGGGPVGLAAAAHLVKKEEPFILFESGDGAGSSIKEWSHVRMFSPWQYNVDAAAKELLEASGWEAPDDQELPAGKELIERYLLPLSSLPAIKKNILLQAKVTGIARKAHDKLKTGKRDSAPFQIYVDVEDSTELFEARAVIDCSGTWTNPNPILSNGIWTKSERTLRDRIHYGIPDIQKQGSKYKNKTIAVVGSGHSAINGLLELARLKEEYPDTAIHWILRKKHIAEVYGGQENDGLPARGELGARIQQLVESGAVEVLTPFHISKVQSVNGKLALIGELNGEEMSIGDIDEIVAGTGFRPDTAFLHEVRLQLDAAVESAGELAPLIDPNIHSCGTVRPHGEKELRQPEKDFYIAGMKSYGRAPTFLLATGYEQVRSIVAYLTGDKEGAKEVQLELPETGVCSTNIQSSCCVSDTMAASAGQESCCGPAVVASLELKNL